VLPTNILVISYCLFVSVSDVKSGLFGLVRCREYSPYFSCLTPTTTVTPAEVFHPFFCQKVSLDAIEMESAPVSVDLKS